jgi:hypothetical protein
VRLFLACPGAARAASSKRRPVLARPGTSRSRALGGPLLGLPGHLSPGIVYLLFGLGQDLHCFALQLCTVARILPVIDAVRRH